jgi:pimeloyl-ACP methyl ester carboxylesterase
VDLRGWGDSEPSMLPYEIPSWASRERFFAYSSAALGDSTMAMRVRDGLAVLDFLRGRPETKSDGVILSGCGLGALVAAHVAAIDQNLGGLVIWDALRRFEDLLEAADWSWSPECFIPGVLTAYEIPDLLRSASCPIRWINPLDGAKQPIKGAELDALQREIGPQSRVSQGEQADVQAALVELLTEV